MENIPTKVDGVDVLPATQWNQVPDEIENAITSTGIGLSSGDLFQLGKAIANYAAQGDFYSDSGAADAYVLSVLASKQAPTSYTDGMRVRFIPGNVNTGASTVNVASLGVKSIKTPAGAVLSSGDIDVNGVTLQYDSSNGWFILYDIASGGAPAVLTEIFTSTEQTISTAGLLTIPHGLSTTPSLIQCRLICKTAELNYSIGNEVIINNLSQDAANNGQSITIDATNLTVRYGSSGSGVYQIPDKTTGTGAVLTNGNWRLVIRAWA